MEKTDLRNLIYSINKYEHMRNDKMIIIRISNELKTEYENLLDKQGMNLSKRIKLLITEDIKKMKMKNDNH